MKAVWNGEVVAESDDTVVVEGNHYFPVSALRSEFFKKSSQTTSCPWKGIASYYDLEVGAQQNPGAAWYYAAPKEAARQIEGRVAFWRGVEVSE